MDDQTLTIEKATNNEFLVCVKVAACLIAIISVFELRLTNAVKAAEPESLEFSQLQAINGDAIHGELRPSDFSTLSAEIAARIEDISVREGEAFKKGQIIVSLDCVLFQAHLDKAKAVLLGAEKKYQTEARLNQLNSTGKLELELAAVEVSKAKADVRTAKFRVSKCYVIAPYDGRVTTLKARPYQFAQVGMPILDVLNETSLEIEFIASSARIAEFAVGKHFLYQVNETGKSYAAAVVRRGAQIDPVSQSIRFIGHITVPHDDLVPGMTGTVTSVQQ